MTFLQMQMSMLRHLNEKGKTITSFRTPTLHNCWSLDNSSNGWLLSHLEHASRTVDIFLNLLVSRSTAAARRCRTERWSERLFGKPRLTGDSWTVVCLEFQARAIDAATAIDCQMAVVEQLTLCATLYTRSRCIWRASCFPFQTFELWHY